MMRWAMFLFVVTFALTEAGLSQVATVGSVIGGATVIQDKLNNVVGNAGVEGRSVVNGANGTLNGAIQELKNLVNNDLTKPVNTLSDTARNMATTIQNTTDELNALINIRSTCIFEGTDRLIYGVKTLSSQLQNAIPFIKDSQPYVYTFKFNGHSDGVVPEGGGRVNLTGFSLWNNNIAPQVELVDEHRKMIRALDAGQAGDDNSVSVQLDGGILNGLVGRCAEFQIVPREKRGWWIFGHVVDDAPRYLPICVPPTNDMSFRVKAHTEFKCTNNTPVQTMNLQNFRCDNSSCDGGADCNVQHSWVIPNGCTVTGLGKSQNPDTRNGSTMNFTYVGGNVQANGKIDSASCVNVGFVHHLDHSTIWSFDAAPQIQCTADSWVPSEVMSEPAAISTNSVPVCVDLPRSCATLDTTSTAEIDLLQSGHEHNSPGDAVTVPSVTTPKLTLSSNVTSPFTDIQFNGMTVKGTVNPAAGATVQTCVTVQVDRCGY
jgi:hypothetical protein